MAKRISKTKRVQESFTKPYFPISLKKKLQILFNRNESQTKNEVEKRKRN